MALHKLFIIIIHHHRYNRYYYEMIILGSKNPKAKTEKLKSKVGMARGSVLCQPKRKLYYYHYYYYNY